MIWLVAWGAAEHPGWQMWEGMLLSAGPQGNKGWWHDPAGTQMEQGVIFLCFGVEDNVDRLLLPPSSFLSSRVPFCIAEAGMLKFYFPAWDRECGSEAEDTALSRGPFPALEGWVATAGTSCSMICSFGGVFLNPELPLLLQPSQCLYKHLSSWTKFLIIPRRVSDPALNPDWSECPGTLVLWGLIPARHQRWQKPPMEQLHFWKWHPRAMMEEHDLEGI